MLRLEGYDVVTALTAETGLKKVAMVRPDAVLVDLRLPLVDGLAFLRRLRANEVYRQTPAAIVTGDYFLTDAERRELRALIRATDGLGRGVRPGRFCCESRSARGR
jgi:CheY-like chemotaxis protein